MAQPPQLRGSVSTLTQVPLQRLVSPPHAQLPLLHEEPGGHALPHPPQLEGSRFVSMHAPLHAVCPAEHVHLPPVHP